MNNNKRKIDEICDTEEENKKSVCKNDNEHDSTNSKAANSESGERDDSGDQNKSVDGAEFEKPGNSDESASENATKETVNDQDGDKRTHSDGSGVLLFSGATNWDLVGRNRLPKNAKNATGENLWGPHRLAALQGIRVLSAHSSSCSAHSVIIAEGGKVYTWGRNEKGQLGHDDIKRRDVPTLLQGLKGFNVISAACGRDHSLYLIDSGAVYASGDNKMGQCGVGSKLEMIGIPTKVNFKGWSITKIACGGEFSVIIDKNGGLYSFGCPEYGQLGHNSDGQYIDKKKINFKCELVPRRISVFIEKTREGHVLLVDSVQIVSVACGINHTVAMDSRKRCFSFGFGGYGRLGHAETKDEMVPRLIKLLDGPNRGVKEVFAGSTYSMAINEHDVLYFWGQNKPTGEATMYPKPVRDLAGWRVRDVGCSKSSIVCIADDSVISWGPSPTFGELGYGSTTLKTSPNPREVDPLRGVHINSVECGCGHTLLIARDDTQEERDKLDQFPEFTP